MAETHCSTASHAFPGNCTHFTGLSLCLNPVVIGCFAVSPSFPSILLRLMKASRPPFPLLHCLASSLLRGCPVQLVCQRVALQRIHPTISLRDKPHYMHRGGGPTGRGGCLPFTLLMALPCVSTCHTTLFPGLFIKSCIIFPGITGSQTIWSLWE